MKITINGHIVSYDANANAGARYLAYELNASEQKVFFDQAFSRGQAVFEDHAGVNYKLVHHGAEYQLTRV